MIEEVVLYLIGGLIFLFIQSLVINGVYESLKGGIVKDDLKKTETYQGQILYMLFPKFIEKNKFKYWSRPLYSCIRCMSSVHGGLTFWPVVIYLFGFRYEEIFVYVMDVFALMSLNWWVYKKL